MGEKIEILRENKHHYIGFLVDLETISITSLRTKK